MCYLTALLCNLVVIVLVKGCLKSGLVLKVNVSKLRYILPKTYFNRNGILLKSVVSQIFYVLVRPVLLESNRAGAFRFTQPLRRVKTSLTGSFEKGCEANVYPNDTCTLTKRMKTFPSHLNYFIKVKYVSPLANDDDKSGTINIQLGDVSSC